MSMSSSITILLILLLLNPSSPSPIKTVVVLVMENRSFDHMLGWMKMLNPGIDGVDGSESNPLSTTDPNSPLVFFGNHSHFVDPDPGHSFQAIREQIFDSNETSRRPPPMNGFAQQAHSMDPNMTQVRHERIPPRHGRRLQDTRLRIRRLRQVVGFRPCLHPAQPPLRPLRNLPQLHQQCRLSAREGLPAAHNLREPGRRRNIVRNILPEHSRHAVLQEPEEAKVPEQVPSVRVVVQERRHEREAPGVRCGGAAVHGLKAGAGQRRSSVARCVPGADVREGGLRDAEGQPAVERDAVCDHVRRARWVLRSRSHTGKWGPDSRLDSGARPVLLQVRPTRR